ncbi:MAG: hypothetical protein ACRD1K_12960 [Acidimicrobiales bacterium]
MRFRVDSKPARSLAEAVVLGTISKVEPGKGFVVDAVDSPSGQVVDFADPKALWRSFHLIVSVRESLGGISVPDTVRVGIAFDGASDVKAVEQGLMALGDVLLFLERSPVFAYDPGLYGIVEDGALLATLDARGQIRLPAKDADEAASLLTGGNTLEALRRASTGQLRTVEVRLDAGVPSRP